YKGDDWAGAGVAELDEALGGWLSQLRARGDITGQAHEVLIFPTFENVPARFVAVVGLGERAELDVHGVRLAAGRLLRKASAYKLQSLGSSLFGSDLPGISKEALAQAFVEGAALATYRFAGYAQATRRSEAAMHTTSSFAASDVSGEDQKTEGNMKQLWLATAADAGVAEGITRGLVCAEAVHLARDWVNTPGNLLTPAAWCEQVATLAAAEGLKLTVLERADMERLRMGALLAVSQGSDQPPKLMVLQYQGKPSRQDVLAFVGKGVTFDAGGISIKPAANMDEMKMDMAGGAAALAAVWAISRLKLPVNVMAVVPCCENLPSGQALKPGDVITALTGQTIEVLNTDAEGRLILADAVAYAKQLGATHLVDIATLTGAVVVALGKVTTAALTNDERFLQELQAAAAASGEKVWPLPTFAEYREQLRSDIADMKNVGGRPAGTITAGLLIGAFVGDTPWIHLDIAGTAWTEKAGPMGPKGATGVMVRTLVELARRWQGGRAS
ncbi:MAG: leucyl aminopeptidase, partial [Alicyclobacillus sp.]|nr:leucyl aminopeptidase [Alicyclobacillus sp.]